MEVRSGYKQTEIGAIPQDWDVKRLGELGSIVRGGSPRPAGDPRYFNGNFIPWLTVAALTNIPEHALEVTETVGFLTEEGASHSRTLAAGTLIIANSGATLGVAKILGVTCCANDGIAAIVNQQSGEKPFICYYINTRTKSLRDVVATGNGQPNLNTGLIRSIAVPCPPPPEQRAIASALSDVDALLGGLDRLIAKKRDLKHAAMQHLLTGQTRLPGFHGEWDVKTLDELGEVSGAGVDKKTRLDEPPVRLVNYMDVYRRSFIYSKDLDHVVSARAEQVARCAVRKGDVFFTPSSEMPFDIAASAVAMEDIPDAAYSYHVVRLRLAADWDLPFRAHIFHTQEFLDQAARASEGSGVRYVITQGRFRGLSVRFPKDKPEQTAIASVLSDMDAELAVLEARRDKTRYLKQAMIQELLTGKMRLVPAGGAHA
jgi:type I restriction enzyme S subunit